MKNTHAIETNGSGRLVLLFLSSVPHMEGRPVEVKVLQRKCQRHGTAGRSLDLICDAVSFCGHMIIDLTKNGILAPPDADLPSPESRMKTPGSPPEPPGAQSREHQEHQGRVNRPSFPIQNLFIISHCVLPVPRMHMISFPQKCLRMTIISATVASRYKT